MTTASYGLGERGRSVPAAQGVVLGLLATGVGLAVAELVAGLIRGSESPVVAVGEEFIDRTPPALRDWAIEMFGTSDKQMLVAGSLITITAIGILIGVLAVRGQMRLAVVATVVVGLIGAWAVWSRPGFSLSHLWPTVAGTAASLGVLRWYHRLPVRPSADGTPSTVDRRTFVTGALALGSTAVVSAGVGRALQGRFSVSSERRDLTLPDDPRPLGSLPADADLGVEGVTPFVVSNDDFYRIDTALIVPQVRAREWELRITGMVEREITLSYDELLALPQVERYVTLSCVSNYVGGPYVGNALWQGTLLAPVLEQAGVDARAEQLVSRSHDGWTAGSPIEQILDGRDAMLAIGMNGEPLPAAHGYPVRLVVPGLYGYVSATKWVTELEVTTWDAFDAYWVPRGWAAIAPFKMTTRIDTPRDGASRPAGPLARRRGLAAPRRDQSGAGVDRWWRLAGGRPRRRAEQRHVAAMGVPVGRGTRPARAARPGDRHRGQRADRRGGGCAPERRQWLSHDRGRDHHLMPARSRRDQDRSRTLALRASISSSKLFWKLATPSRSRRSATSSMSTPTWARAAHTRSASSRSRSIVGATVP